MVYTEVGQKVENTQSVFLIELRRHLFTYQEPDGTFFDKYCQCTKSCKKEEILLISLIIC